MTSRSIVENPAPSEGSFGILGQTVRRSISAEELETFAAPGLCSEVQFVTEEFASLCPITEQPDTSTVSIRYRPRGKCIESKSLKLWLWSYRDRGVFVEGIAAELAEGVCAATGAPTQVVIEQRVRGGIVTTAVAETGGWA